MIARPDIGRITEAERLLGHAYWDDGGSDVRSVVARLMADPAASFTAQDTRLHSIFGRDLPEPDAHVGRLLLFGRQDERLWAPLDNLGRPGFIRPVTNERFRPYRIGDVVKVEHGETHREGSVLYRRVDLVSAVIDAAVQVVRWPQTGCWWLWLRDGGSLRLFARPAVPPAKWWDASHVLDLFSPDAWRPATTLEE